MPPERCQPKTDGGQAGALLVGTGAIAVDESRQQLQEEGHMHVKPCHLLVQESDQTLHVQPHLQQVPQQHHPGMW